MTGQVFSDEDLTAYLDGEAEARLEAALSEALETDEVLQARLERFDVPIAAIRDGYAALLADAPPMPALGGPVDRTPLWRGVGTFAAGIAAGVGFAVVSGLFSAPEAPAPLGWKAVVANYQALYGTDTLAAETPSSAEQAAQLAQVSAAIGLDLSDLPQTANLTFRRAQVLDFRGRPLAQIAYTRPDGTPVALCILQSKTPADTLVTAALVQEMGTASWQTGMFGFLLIGGDAPADLSPDAARFAAWSQATL